MEHGGRTVLAKDVTIGVRFFDPHRHGRPAAEVKQIAEVSDTCVVLVLDDDSKWPEWTDEFHPSEELELIEQL